MQFVEFISQLLDSKEQAIVWHNQTMSYAEHKALDFYQDEIAELYDGLVESVSGIYDRPTHYELDSPVDYKKERDFIRMQLPKVAFFCGSPAFLHDELKIENAFDVAKENNMPIVIPTIIAKAKG